MTGPFGYKSEEDFRQAIDREMEEMNSHSAGRYGEKEQPSQKALRGKPGSKERLRQVAAMAGVDQQLVNTVARDVSAEKLLRVVRQLQRDGLSVEAVEEAVRLSMDIDRADVAELVVQVLPDDAADFYWDSLGNAIEQREDKAERDAEEYERKRLENREAFLQDEYDQAAMHSPEAVDAVDSVAHEIGAEILYDEESDPAVIAAMMRTRGYAAASERDALGQFGVHAQLDEEFRKVGAPGSSWNDADRARWEAEMREGTLEAVNRHYMSPEEAAAAAVESVYGEPGATFGEQVSQELDNLSTPPEHEQRLRDANLEAWEAANPDKLP